MQGAGGRAPLSSLPGAARHSIVRLAMDPRGEPGGDGKKRRLT